VKCVDLKEITKDLTEHLPSVSDEQFEKELIEAGIEGCPNIQGRTNLKIGVINDTHIRETNPKSRKDDYIVALLKKYMEVGELIQTYQIDLLVHTGDMFDGPRIDNEISGLFAGIMKEYLCPMVVVPGNHDIFGYSMQNINKTTLGLLAKAGVFNLLTRATPTTCKTNDGLVVSIQGQEFTPDVDKNPDKYIVDIDLSAQYHVLFVHGNILDKPGPPNMDYVLADDIPASNTPYPAIICAGHYHPGFKTMQSKNNPFIINNGSMGRNSASVDVQTRIPGMTILEFDKNGWKENFVEFKSAQPGIDVFDFNTNVQKKAKSNFLSNFRQSLANTANIKPYDVMKILNEKASKAGCLTKCLKMLSDADALHAQVTQKLQGYVDCGYTKRITRIEIENFMSHSNTVIDLNPETNMFVGPSNNGKSVIIRLVRWVCFDDPKGADFIKLGESKTRGKIYYDDGTWIERERTRSAAGTLKVFDGKQVYDFTKWGHQIPIEVLNVHQMPDVILAKDKRINLSVSEQLDAPFLLSESPSIRAAIIGTLAGLDAFDVAIRENSKGIAGIQKGIKEKEKIVSDFINKLGTFTDLSDMETKIASATVGIDVIEELTNTVQDIDQAIKDFTAMNTNIATSDAELKRIKAIDAAKLLVLLDNASDIDVEVAWLNEALDKSLTLNKYIQGYQETQASLPNITGLLDLIDQGLPLEDDIKELTDFISQSEHLQSEMVRVQQSLNNIPNTNGLSDYLSLAEQLNPQIEEIDIFQRDISTIYTHINTTKSNLSDTITASKRIRDTYTASLREAKVCGECFSILDDARIALILDNVTGVR